MDTLTHIVVGACIGELMTDRRLGKHSLQWGALAQILPDIDVISATWLDPTEGLLAHRGITHSLFFMVLASPLLAWLARRIHISRGLEFRQLTLFFGIQVLVHIFLDAFNAYGTGWFEPFNHSRISLNTIFVVDPLFTLFPLVAATALWIRPFNYRFRRRFARVALGASFLYLLICLWNKGIVDTDIQQSLKRQNITYYRYFTTPAPLNNLLWLVVAESDSGYYMAYRSVFDKTDKVPFSYYNRNAYLLRGLSDPVGLDRLLRFSKGYYTVGWVNDTLEFNDLRFGQVMGWTNPEAPFVFHYHLQKEGNEMVMQRGRLNGWNRKAFRDLFRRMMGN